MNDNRFAHFSACFHELLQQDRFVVRAHGQANADERSRSADGPDKKSLSVRLNAPVDGHAVIPFGKRPDFPKSLAIQFP
jgi:hypothetical protein